MVYRSATSATFEYGARRPISVGDRSRAVGLQRAPAVIVPDLFMPDEPEQADHAELAAASSRSRSLLGIGLARYAFGRLAWFGTAVP